MYYGNDKLSSLKYEMECCWISIADIYLKLPIVTSFPCVHRKYRENKKPNTSKYQLDSISNQYKESH